MKKLTYILVFLFSNLGFSNNFNGFYELDGKGDSDIIIANKVSNGFYTLLPTNKLTSAQNFFDFSKQFDFGNSITLELSYLLNTNRVLQANKLSLEDLSGLNLSLDYTFNSNLSNFRRYVGIEAGISPAIHMGGEYYFSNNSYIKADLSVHTVIYPSIIAKQVVPVASLSYGVRF